MFKIADADHSGLIDFIEFMKYIFLLLEGDKFKKTEFIFKMIALEKSSFNYQDLTKFYFMVNNDDENAFFGENNESEKEMTNIAFKMMDKKKNQKINFFEFEKFIKKDENHLKLFNFLRGDADSSRKDIRQKRSFLIMMNTFDQLTTDINNLENLLQLSKIDLNNKKNGTDLGKNRRTTGRVSQFENNFRSVLKKNFQMNSNILDKIHEGNEFEDIDQKDSQEFSTEKNKEQHIKEMMLNIKKQESEKENPKEKDVLFKHNNLSLVKSLTNSIRLKVEQLKLNLKKEIKLLKNNSKLLNNIKKTVKSNKKKEDNKKVVFLNNPNWNIVTTMITGISNSISFVSDDKYHFLTKNDFGFKNSIDIGAVYSNTFNKCEFIDYAPYAFRGIRKQFGIRSDEYLKSIGINTFKNAFFDKLYLMLSETSSGKSGSFFFHSADGKYMLKTIKKKEFEVLMNILPQYYGYVVNNSNTLLTRYYGLHQMKCYKDKKFIYDIYIIVFNNVFDIENPELIKNKYDLKGSTYNRITSQRSILKGAAKKDLNLIREGTKIYLDSKIKDKVLFQISKDIDFLSQNKIIDYSLLVGIIKEDDDDIGHKPLFENSLMEKSKVTKNLIHSRTFIESSNKQTHYYIGIIDTLTHFGGLKKTEFVAKRVFQGKGISCVPPVQYRKRFYEFSEKIIVSDDKI